MRDLCEQKEADDNFMNAIQTLKKASLLFWKGFNVLVQEDEVRIVPETLCKLHKKKKKKKKSPHVQIASLILTPICCSFTADAIFDENASV